MKKMLAPLGVVALLGSMLAGHQSAAGEPPVNRGAALGDGPQLDVERALRRHRELHADRLEGRIWKIIDATD